jgi:hypothetical protein
MLTQYSPWGRPGCGAPNADGIRKRKLHLQGLFAEEEKVHAQYIETYIPPFNFPNFQFVFYSVFTSFKTIFSPLCIPIYP